MQHQRDVERRFQFGNALDIQLGGGLFLVQQVGGDGAVHAAHGHAQPVAAAAFDKLRGVLHGGEAHLLFKDFLIGNGGLRRLVAHDRAQFGLHGDARGVSDIANGLRGGDIALQREARGVHHHGLIAGLDGALDDGQIVHLEVVLVDDGHMVEVQKRMPFLLILFIFFGDALEALGLELFPLQTRHLNHGHGVFIHHRLHDGLHHRQMGDVERGHDQLVFQRFANDDLGIQRKHLFAFNVPVSQL